MSLRVGIVAHRSLLPETHIACIELDRAMRPVWHHEIGANLEHGRNKVAAATQEDTLLFVDSDMQFKPRDVELLLQALDQKASRGAVSAAYVRWKDGVPVHNWRNGKGWLSDRECVDRSKAMSGVYPVDQFGGGLLAISAEALRKIPSPWFEGIHRGDGSYVEGDSRFCWKLQDAGFEPSVHFGARVKHIGPTAWSLHA